MSNGKTNGRAMMAVISFLFGVAVCGGELYFMFRDKFAAMDGAFIDEVMNENMFLVLMVLAMNMAPAMSLMLWAMNAGGKTIGENAESIARGLNP